METVIKQAEENRGRSLNIANRIHEEYVPLKGEIDHMRREYLGLNPLPDLHEEEGSIISAEYEKQLNAFVARTKANKNTASIFSRFQSSYYHSTAKGTGGGLVNAHTTPSATFSRPTQNAHHPLTAEATVTSLPATNPSGFMAPPPPVGPLRLNKPPEIGVSNRMQQTPSIGMAHPTFRSEFNVNLRYFFCLISFVFVFRFSTIFILICYDFVFDPHFSSRLSINFCSFVFRFEPNASINLITQFTI